MLIFCARSPFRCIFDICVLAGEKSDKQKKNANNRDYSHCFLVRKILSTQTMFTNNVETAVVNVFLSSVLFFSWTVRFPRRQCISYPLLTHLPGQYVLENSFQYRNRRKQENGRHSFCRNEIWFCIHSACQNSKPKHRPLDCCRILLHLAEFLLYHVLETEKK